MLNDSFVYFKIEGNHTDSINHEFENALVDSETTKKILEAQKKREVENLEYKELRSRKGVIVLRKKILRKNHFIV